MAAMFTWWLMIEAMGLMALPWTLRLFGAASAHGYPFAKILFVLVWTYFAWLAAFVIPMTTALYGVLALLVSIGVAGYIVDQDLRKWLASGGLRTILIHDGLFLIGFAFFAFQRSMVPDINGAEKFMDFAFLNSLLNAQSMPPPDPWMSGGTINYYYFGYLMFANLLRVFVEPAHVAYNLCVATIGGLAFSQTAAVAFALTRRWGYALLGGAMSAFLGNLDGAQQLYEKGTIRGIDVWRSSRVVGRGDTINEFPFFSTIHGDLHPHFIVLPVAIVFIAALCDERLFPSHRSEAQSRQSWVGMAFATFLLASIVGISTWELPLGAVALTLLGGRAIPLQPLFSRQRLIFAAQVAAALALTYVLFLPFYNTFQAPPSSPAFKVATSSLGQFLLVFGHFLFAAIALIAVRAWNSQPEDGESRHLLAAAAAGLGLVFALMAGNGVLPLLAILLGGAIFMAYRGDDEASRTGYLLIATATIALIACEVAFLRDSYGEKLYRMNTVFKLYFQAWTILAIVTPWCIFKVLTWPSLGTAVRAVYSAVLAALLAGTACYPIGVTQDRLAWGRPHTLDGNAYLAQHHSGDYGAIEWLRANAAKDAVILEASGNPYSYSSRFSSNTGLPTVMGWANHEGLWRGHDRVVGKRKTDVHRIYNSPTLDPVRRLLSEYGVRYILVGEIERKDHAAGLQKFESLPRVFQHNNTAIYEVR